MDRMKALVKTGKGEAEVRKVEKPEDRTVVKTLRAGIDGTDREVLDESREIFPEGADHMVMAHEAIGRVVDSDDFKEGQLVVPTVRRPTDKCDYLDRPDFCPSGQYVERGINGAHGYCSEYFSEINPEYLIPVPDELEEVGVLIEPTSIVEKAVSEVFRAQERMDYRPKRALVLGGGSIGLLATMLLRKKGLEVQTVDIVDSDHPKAGIIEATGAEYVDNRERNIEQLEQPDLVLEGSGVTSQIFESLKHMRPNGALVSVGLPRDRDGKLEVESGKIHEEMVLGNKMFIGSVNSSVEHFRKAIHHMKYFQKNYPVERILDTQASLGNWEDAFNPDIKGEIVFE